MALVSKLDTRPLGPKVLIYNAVPTAAALILDGAQPGDLLIIQGEVRIVAADHTITSNPASDVVIRTYVDNKAVLINSRSFTQATGDSIGAKATVNQTVTSTGEVYTNQWKARASGAISVVAVNVSEIDFELKSGADASGDIRGFNMYAGATDAGSTIGGDVVHIRARAEINVNPTGDIVFLNVLSHEGSQAWDGLVKFVSSGDGNTAVGSHPLLNSDAGSGALYASIPVIVKGVGTKFIRLYTAS